MNLLGTPVVMVVLVGAQSSALAADWKFAGHQTGATQKDAQVGFYDADSVAKTGRTVRYWTVAIKLESLHKVMRKGGKTSQQKLMVEAVNRFNLDQLSPVLALPAYRQSVARSLAGEEMTVEERTLSIIALELAANRHAQPVFRILSELDCGRKVVRALDVTTFDGRGNVEPGSGPIADEWRHVPPDTSAFWLSKVFCD